MMSIAYFVEMPVDFPEGVHFGAGKQFNVLAVARDGLGRPVLNGSSLAGVMRSVWRDYLKSDPDNSSQSIAEAVELLFGTRCERTEHDDPSARPSAVRVTNTELMLGTQNPSQRTHHQRNRHRGTVIKGALYSAESCPPGTRANIRFWIGGPTNSLVLPRVAEPLVKEFLTVVSAAFQHGICVGGNSNRGIGRAELNPNSLRVRRFDLGQLNEHAAYLDAVRSWAGGGGVSGTQIFEPLDEASPEQPLQITLKLRVPRGQDILIADGQGQEAQMEPKRVIGVDGKHYWRIPGSSLRGLFRRWFHRLSAREKIRNGLSNEMTSADPATGYPRRENEKCYTGDQLAWCFQSNDERAHFRPPTDWHVESLFGTCYSPGTIKISDGFSRCTSDEMKTCPECQIRMHVAVDRVTGGAAEGMLFDNYVLTSVDGDSGIFTFQIRLRSPQAHEVRWLAQTLIALNIGVLRVGSSKSSGRLCWHGQPEATGTLSGEFLSIIQKSNHANAGAV